MAAWVVDRIILVLVILAVPWTHGILEYCGLILAGLLMVALNHGVAWKFRGADPPKSTK